MSLWHGRIDEETVPEWALRWHQKVNRYSGQSALPGVTLAGFASDEGVRRNKGRPGAASGPDTLRRALAGQPWNRDQPVYDSGTIICRGGNLESRTASLCPAHFKTAGSPAVTYRTGRWS